MRRDTRCTAGKGGRKCTPDTEESWLSWYSVNMASFMGEVGRTMMTPHAQKVCQA